MTRQTLYSDGRGVVWWLLITLVCAFIGGCTKSKPVAIEAPPAYQPPPPPVVQVPTVVPAKLTEVQDAVLRVFKGAAVLDQNVKPGFIAGDFNGDLTQDIAIAIKPAPGKLDSLNEAYPAWLLRDPFAAADTKSPALHVAEDESLLAIIHGYGANDWRDPQATQTFLLKHVAGSNMEVQPGKEFIKANQGKKLPPIAGDVIGEIVRGQHGYLYYAVASYRWLDQKTYKGEPRRGAFHGAMARK
jgi:hypothetical protein